MLVQACDVGIKSNDLKYLADNIEIYPNPTSDFLHFNANVSKVQIFDIAGRKTGAVEVVNNIADVRSLEKGVYIVRFETAKGSQTQKFIKD